MNKKAKLADGIEGFMRDPADTISLLSKKNYLLRKISIYKSVKSLELSCCRCRANEASGKLNRVVLNRCRFVCKETKD